MLIDFFSGLSPIYQALIATLFTWFVTAAGAGLVFFFKTIERKALDAMLGFAAGVMIAASIGLYLPRQLKWRKNQICLPGFPQPQDF